MAKKLVIVESPAKAKTIEKFLGSDFEVRASMGHIIDLPSKGLGVDVRKNFEPKYETIEKKDKLIKDLKAASKKADVIYLAPDPDREGEFIAWSLKYALGLNNPQRAVFNEITQKAVQDAIKNPRLINEDLFNAQQARRVLDRLVGYKISPLLWRKIQSGTSAGRVQSVALRLICDREAEIKNFVPEEYWTITANLSKKDEINIFQAYLYGKKSDLSLEMQNDEETEESNVMIVSTEESAKKAKIHITNEKEAHEVLKNLESATYIVSDIKNKEVRRQPYPPYTTSSMQQDASAKLYFKPKKTMSLAQGLYEGIELGDKGHQGLITYMRTDSTRISPEAQAQVKGYIHDTWGEQYVGQGRTGKSKGNIQDAHEAIRPTDVSNTPNLVKKYLSLDQFKLYDLIWRRFVASFMSPALFDTVRIDISANVYIFRTTGSNLKFSGFYEVWKREENENNLPIVIKDESLKLHKIDSEQHFTQPPARYNEATLIKVLEEKGIGRPSTYVPIVSTVQDRGYVEQVERRFVPTWLGETVNEVMKKHFADIVDVGFTSEMEHKLDSIEEGQQSWKEFLKGFYEEFKQTLDLATKEIERVQKPVEQLDDLCPECGNPLVLRQSRFGKFVSCSSFPECKYKKSYVAKTGATCPECNGDLIERKTKKFGKVFYGCVNYPTCTFATWDRPESFKCKTCGSLVVQKQGRSYSECTQCDAKYKNGELADLTPDEIEERKLQRAQIPSSRTGKSNFKKKPSNIKRIAKTGKKTASKSALA